MDRQNYDCQDRASIAASRGKQKSVNSAFMNLGTRGPQDDTTLTTYRTRRSPSENSLLYNTTFLCVFLNADKLGRERKISPFYLFTWIFINFRVSTSEFTGTLSIE